MKNIVVSISVLLGLFMTNVLIACDEEKAAIEAEKVTEEQTIKTVVLSAPDSVTKGEKTFNSLCVYCHGAAGSGGKAKKLAGRNLEADYMFKTITEGKKRGSLNMPPWKNLSEEKRWQLVAYLQTLSE